MQPPKVYVVLLSSSPQADGQVVSAWGDRSGADDFVARASREWRKANLCWRVEEHDLRTGQGQQDV